LITKSCEKKIVINSNEFVLGVFMLVAGGIVVGIFIVFLEISYKNSKDKKRREMNVARNAFGTWRKNIEVFKKDSKKKALSIFLLICLFLETKNARV